MPIIYLNREGRSSPVSNGKLKGEFKNRSVRALALSLPRKHTHPRQATAATCITTRIIQSWRGALLTKKKLNNKFSRIRIVQRKLIGYGPKLQRHLLMM